MKREGDERLTIAWIIKYQAHVRGKSNALDPQPCLAKQIKNICRTEHVFVKKIYCVYVSEYNNLGG